MRGQVGYWGSKTGGLCVGFGDEMFRWLDGQACGHRVFVSVSSERQVIVLPDATGGHVSKVGRDRNASPYRYVSSTMPESLFLDIELPPFELLELEFQAEDGCLSTELPDEDYRLPWPRLALDCSTYEAERLAVEALQWRLNSLIASGLTSFPDGARMPQRLHRLLPKGTYAECVRAAKTLAGVS